VGGARGGKGRIRQTHLYGIGLSAQLETLRYVLPNLGGGAGGGAEQGGQSGGMDVPKGGKLARKLGKKEESIVSLWNGHNRCVGP